MSDSELKSRGRIFTIFTIYTVHVYVNVDKVKNEHLIWIFNSTKQNYLIN